MKTVLSYHHACKMSKPGQKTTVDVPESFVHFMVPLCAVVTTGALSASFHPNAANIGGGGGGGGNGTTTATTAAATTGAFSRQQKIELMIEVLVEMFEGALEAGLQAFVDPKELGGGGTDGGGGAGSTPTDKKLSSNKFSTASRGGNTTEGGRDKKPPAWIDAVHDALVPGLQALVDHVTRVHLGLAVAASDDSTESPKENDDIHSKDAAGNTAVAEALSNAENSEKETQHEVGGTLPDAGNVEKDKQQDGERTTPQSERPQTSLTSDSLKNTSRALAKVNSSQARAALWALLRPLLSVGLVGHLNADACLFAWDQAVIGGFGVMLPRVAAMIVAAAADKLQACVTFARLSEALLSHSHLVSVRHRVICCTVKWHYTAVPGRHKACQSLWLCKQVCHGVALL